MASTKILFKLSKVAPSTIHCKDNNKGVCCQFSNTSTYGNPRLLIHGCNFITRKRNKPSSLNQIPSFFLALIHAYNLPSPNELNLTNGVLENPWHQELQQLIHIFYQRFVRKYHVKTNNTLDQLFFLFVATSQKTQLAIVFFLTFGYRCSFLAWIEYFFM